MGEEYDPLYQRYLAGEYDYNEYLRRFYGVSGGNTHDEIYQLALQKHNTQQQERRREKEVEREQSIDGHISFRPGSVEGPGFVVRRNAAGVHIEGYNNFLKLGGALGAVGAAKLLGIEDWFEPMS